MNKMAAQIIITYILPLAFSHNFFQLGQSLWDFVLGLKTMQSLKIIDVQIGWDDRSCWVIERVLFYLITR